MHYIVIPWAQNIAGYLLVTGKGHSEGVYPVIIARDAETVKGKRGLRLLLLLFVRGAAAETVAYRGRVGDGGVRRPRDRWTEKKKMKKITFGPGDPLYV